MSDHTARVAALEDALASGELTIKVEGKETTYRTAADLLKALTYFRDQQRIASGAAYATTLATFGAD